MSVLLVIGMKDLRYQGINFNTLNYWLTPIRIAAVFTFKINDDDDCNLMSIPQNKLFND